jgi:hypothetical protein
MEAAQFLSKLELQNDDPPAILERHIEAESCFMKKAWQKRGLREGRRSQAGLRFGPSLALKLIGECGTDLRAWPTAKHFTSWLCLAPGNKISCGKVLSSRTRRSSNRAAALLRLAATTIGRSDTTLGAFYRRLSSRAGKAKAVTATARKIAVLFYTPSGTAWPTGIRVPKTMRNNIAAVSSPI